MNENTLSAIKRHVAREYPREACGVICVIRGREQYIQCRNIAENDGQFVMHHADYAEAEDLGEVVAIVHSHCNLPPTPSQADLVGCEKTGKPWVIVSWPTGQVHEFLPTGYRAPLVGREYCHGVLDCYAVCRDYYKEVLDIDLPDTPREDEWWLHGKNLYLENFEALGFVRVDLQDLKVHDGIFMQLCSPVPNHAAVYLGDGKILQHVMNRLSSRDVYGGWYRKCTVAVVRHRSQL